MKNGGWKNWVIGILTALVLLSAQYQVRSSEEKFNRLEENIGKLSESVNTLSITVAKLEERLK